MGFRQGKRETNTFAGNGGKISGRARALWWPARRPQRREKCRAVWRRAVPRKVCKVRTALIKGRGRNARNLHNPQRRPQVPARHVRHGASALPYPVLPPDPDADMEDGGGGGGGAAAGGLSPTGGPGTEGSPPRTAPDPPRFLPAASFPRGNGTFLSGQGRRDVAKNIIDNYTHP